MTHEDLVRLLREKAELTTEIARLREDVETREQVVRDYEAWKDVRRRSIRARFSGEPSTAPLSRHDMSGGRIRAGTIAWVMIVAALAVTAVLLVPSLFRDETCLDLWNEPDNAAVRSQVAQAGFESAGITSHSFEGPGRVCYVTMFDGARDARGTYVIWPDNLFDNGSLHDYAGPLTGNIGYDGQAIEPTPDLTVLSNGRLRSG